MATQKKKQTTKSESKKISVKQSSKDGMRGEITLDEDVVATIAALCAQDIEGIHSLGKPRLFAFGDSTTRGVDVEVGNEQAAVDLDVVMDYGIDIESCAVQLRERLADEIGKMANRDVVEVNIHVAGIELPETDDEPRRAEQPRVV